jgi:hypothetical protein
LVLDVLIKLTYRPMGIIFHPTGGTNMKSRSHGAAALSLMALVYIMMTAPTAQAGVDHWFSGSLPYQFGWASTAAHSISYIQGSANHDTFCVGLEQGVTGSYFDAPAYSDCYAYSSGGGVSVYFTPTCCFHATIVNGGPFNPISVNSATHYDY